MLELSGELLADLAGKIESTAFIWGIQCVCVCVCVWVCACSLELFKGILFCWLVCSPSSHLQSTTKMCAVERTICLCHLSEGNTDMLEPPPPSSGSSLSLALSQGPRHRLADLAPPAPVPRQAMVTWLRKFAHFYCHKVHSLIPR